MGAHERLVVLEDRDLEVGNLVGVLRSRVESLESRVDKLETSLTKIETYLYRHTGGGAVGKVLPWYGDGGEAAKMFPDIPVQQEATNASVHAKVPVAELSEPLRGHPVRQAEPTATRQEEA